MNFAELCDEVYTLTGRDDLVAETKSAVKSATLKMHQSDFYPRDIVEIRFQFSTAEYVQSFEYSTLLKDFRAIKYLRPFDVNSGVVGKELTVLDPDNLFDSYHIEKTNVCYLAGQYIQIKTTTQSKDFLFGYYALPNITENGYKSWISLYQPFAIVYDAAATIFKLIGKDEESSTSRQLVAEQVGLLKMCISQEGY